MKQYFNVILFNKAITNLVSRAEIVARLASGKIQNITGKLRGWEASQNQKVKLINIHKIL